MSTENAVRFFFNGLKVGKSSLITGHWSYQRAFTSGNRVVGEHITFYAREYGGLPDAVRAMASVRNGTDSQTDYFETDRFNLTPGHPRWTDALAASVKDLERCITRIEKSGRGSDSLGMYRESVVEMKAAIEKNDKKC